MCDTDAVYPVHNVRTLTTYAYPTLITATPCECTFVVFTNTTSSSSASMSELMIRFEIEFRRKDDSDQCQATEILITTSRSDKFIICPDLLSDIGIHTQDVTLPLMPFSEKMVIKLANSQLEFVNARIGIKTCTFAFDA